MRLTVEPLSMPRSYLFNNLITQLLTSMFSGSVSKRKFYVQNNPIMTIDTNLLSYGTFTA